MRNEKEERLESIKLKYVLFPKKCECCKKHYKKEKMWKVNRYGINQTCHEWYYCQNCMHSAEDVLNEIDTDEVPFGIFDVDDYISFKKKDSARMNDAMAFSPIS